MRWPAEWEPHRSVWIGFPGDPAEWPVARHEAQQEVAAFANAVADQGAGETVILVCRTADDGEIARTLSGVGVEIVVEPFGDIWLRDSAPIFVAEADGLVGQNFGFNGWGGKYAMAGDQDIGERLAQRFGLAVRERDWILEGGAIDVDGTGLAVTTEQCLLNPNRNKGMSRDEIEARLKRDLGLDRILWLGDGLLNDHTDGHVDNLARFVGENRLAIPVAAGADDPNAAVYEDARARAEAFGVEVLPIPSPGRVTRDGAIIPASYMNFYIGNGAVVVPLYDVPNDDAVVGVMSAVFPGRQVAGLRADHILTGGGSFHCISQQVPV